MTISAPHDGKAPLSTGVAANSDETMEEVGTPVARLAPPAAARPIATENDRNSSVPAPLRAPQATAPAFDQLAYARAWRRGPGKALFAAGIQRWRERNRVKKHAHDAVAYALRVGKLTRGACEREGSGCSGRIEAHHDDYARKLEVRWLCRRHHGEADRERGSRRR